MESELKIAILIDAENISSKYASIILQEAAGLGNVIYKRIYGDWTTPTLNSWKKVLLENAIQPVQQFSNTYGKNSSDSALIIDAMDLLYQHKLDAFCIVSSDSDFTRLASRLRESQMFVLGMGEKKTPRAFISACNKFSYLDLLYQSAQKQNSKRGRSYHKFKGFEVARTSQAAEAPSTHASASSDANANTTKTSNALAKTDSGALAKTDGALPKDSGNSGAGEHARSDTSSYSKSSHTNANDQARASDNNTRSFDDASKTNEEYGEGSNITVVTNTLREITEEFSGDDGWIISSTLGAHLSKRLPDFDTRNFGFRKFVPFVTSLGLFESKSIPTTEDTGVKMVYFRLIEE